MMTDPPPARLGEELRRQEWHAECGRGGAARRVRHERRRPPGEARTVPSRSPTNESDSRRSEHISRGVSTEIQRQHKRHIAHAKAKTQQTGEAHRDGTTGSRQTHTVEIPYTKRCGMGSTCDRAAALVDARPAASPRCRGCSTEMLNQRGQGGPLGLAIA